MLEFFLEESNTHLSQYSWGPKGLNPILPTSFLGIFSVDNMNLIYKVKLIANQSNILQERGTSKLYSETNIYKSHMQIMFIIILMRLIANIEYLIIRKETKFIRSGKLGLKVHSTIWKYMSLCFNEYDYLKGHWKSITTIFLYLILLRILNQTNTLILSWFCQCVFILWGILLIASSSVCPIGYCIAYLLKSTLENRKCQKYSYFFKSKSI